MQCYIITPWLLLLLPLLLSAFFYIFFIYFDYFYTKSTTPFRILLFHCCGGWCIGVTVHKRILFVVFSSLFSLVSFSPDISRFSLFGAIVRNFTFFLFSCSSLFAFCIIFFSPSLARFTLSTTHFSCKIPCITNFYIFFSFPGSHRCFLFFFFLLSFLRFKSWACMFKLKCYAIFVSTV